MLSRYSDKNKFGGYTWQIKLDSLFHIFVEDSMNKTFVVTFKEWKWMSYKTHFSFVSNLNLIETIKDAFEKIFDFFQSDSKYEWNHNQKNNKLNEVIELIKISNDPVTIEYSNRNLNMTDNTKTLNIIRGVGIDENIVNLTMAQMIFEKYGEPENIINHNNYSMELQYSNKGMSFFYKISDPLKMIYFMMATGEIKCETETGLIFDKNLTMDKVLDDYGMGKPVGNDESEEAKMSYSGILFYVNKFELMNLQGDEIHIKKIGILEL